MLLAGSRRELKLHVRGLMRTVAVFVVGANGFSNVRVYAPWWAGDLKIMGIMMCV